MLSILLLALASPAPAAPIAIGPPAICFPLAIGDARSLPWGDDGAFAISKSYDVARLPVDALALLDASDETLVHMETLRRAAIYVSGADRRRSAEEERLGRAVAIELVSKLRARVIDAVLAADGAQPVSQRAQALRWFDLGYLLATLEQIGGGPKESFDAALARAVELAPDDGALRLGVALGLWSDGAQRWKSLDAACARVRGEQDLLSVNLIGTAGRILGCNTHAELRAEIRRHAG